MKSALSALALAAFAAASPVHAFDINAMTDDERAAFGAQVRSFLMENPEVIIEAVNALEARQADQQAMADVTMVQDNAAALFDNPDSWVGGNPDGDLVLVEFLDYRCGYCRKAHAEVEDLLTFDGNIKLIVKEFPILGENSTVSSRFALAVRAVAGDDAYKASHDALLALTGDATEPALRRLAGTLGLDADAVLAEMSSPEIDRIIAETRALAQTLQINGTPTFVMGDQMLRGYVPLQAMQQIAAEQRQEG